MSFKYTGITIIIVAVLNTMCKAQITDTALIKRLSVNGVCLCNATLSSLRQQDVNLTEVKVEEMDLPKNCFSQDSRYEAGKGYHSDKYPGMIFQKDQNTDQISKIRLTKEFKGNLPDGKFIDMNKLSLSDIFKMYPGLKNKWGSRDCSDYWNFSNDTLSFFLKIDKNKQPQFPVDEAYYDDKQIAAVDLAISCYGFSKSDHQNAEILSNPNEPVFYLNGTRVNQRVLENFDPSEFASVTVYRGKEAIGRAGPDAKSGLFYIETKKFAKQRYWNYFKSKSAEYAKIVPEPEMDSTIQYVLNAKALTDNYEADLSAINDKTFKGITIITKEQLKKDYGVTSKKYGVIILSEGPEKAKK